MLRIMMILNLLCVLFWSVAAETSAAVIHVPGDEPDIQAGIDAAEDGDTVLAADGTYTERGLDFLGKAITVASENGPENCIVDCQGYGRGFHFHWGEEADSVLEGFTIRNGEMNVGGGIYCQTSSPMIKNCNVVNNGFTGCAGFGGGIACSYSSAHIVNCTIADNTIDGCDLFGGGIYTEYSTITVTGSRIAGNQALCVQTIGVGYGGGVYSMDGLITINDTVISGNYAGYEEGMYIDAEGGGLYCDASGALLTNCLITGNVSNGDGYGGEGVGKGGGIRCASIEMYNCTIADNYASDHGDGIDGSGAIIENSIIWDGLNLNADSITYSDVMGGYEGEGNIDLDPLFVVGPEGDYYLSSEEAGQPEDSPCIDAGGQDAQDVCFTAVGETLCMNELTTVAGGETDSGIVDMGRHYPVPPQLTPTPFPTCTPGVTHTPTPEIFLGVGLQMPGDYFSFQDPVWLKALLYNYIEPPASVPLFVILDIQGQYWYWDEWTQEIDFNYIELPQPTDELMIISEFSWPDTGQETMSGLHFWAAMLNSSMTDILGGEQGLALWTFGFGPPDI